MESKLTHLCFADDLLIFAEGNLSSVQGILDVLRSFETRSSLALSVSKNSFFTSGVSSAEIDQIRNETGLTHAALPIRYMGIPLCVKKLSMTNCEPLILVSKLSLIPGVLEIFLLQVAYC